MQINILMFIQDVFLLYLSVKLGYNLLFHEELHYAKMDK